MHKGAWWCNSMSYRRRPRRPLSNEQGQTFVLIVIFVAFFLAGVIGLATDYTQLWAHRQTAQAAADAACQAGAADIYMNYERSGTPPTGSGISFSWIGTDFDCTTNTTSPPCQYAQINGFTGNKVSVSFPSTFPGAPDLSPFGSVTHPFIQVTVSNPVQLSFANLLLKTGTANVSAKAICGLNPVNVKIPLLVLHPTAPGAMTISGNPNITILGGPTRSIQVDSSSPSNAVTFISSSGRIDLSHAGPSGTGADFGVLGIETKPGGVLTGSTGSWLSPAGPFGDPWETVPQPSVPGTLGTTTPVPFAYHGCPDPNGCVELTPGDYSSCSTSPIAPGGTGCLNFPYSGTNTRFNAYGVNWQASHSYAAGALVSPTTNNSCNCTYQAQNPGTSGAAPPATWNQTVLQSQPDGGITWKNLGPTTKTPSTAIFDPGLYYVGTSGFIVKQATVRLSTATGDTTNGVMFYFNTAAGAINVTSNAGASPRCTSVTAGAGSWSMSPNNCVVAYNVDGTNSSAATGSVPNRALQCPGGAVVPPQVPSQLDGNILFGPCSGTYGTPSALNHGFLFFQNRAVAATQNWGGGGEFLLSGFMYFHQTGSYGSVLNMSGGSGASAYTLGNIVTDEIGMSGNPNLTMILNPDTVSAALRPQLLQ